jgi:DNA (cytosine-5)-methyltransferase 1
MAKYSLMDLFSGCGGISRGFEAAGFKTLLGLDLDTDSLATFKFNHPAAHTVAEDISKVAPRAVADRAGVGPGDLDCLVGGPPCQSFSKNVPASARFFEDPRNHLYEWFMEFVEDLQPKTVLVENVAELANAHNGYVRDQIMGRLRSLGYAVIGKRLLAADYGVPQLRRRMFFLASRVGDRHLQFPAPTHLPPAACQTLLSEPHYVTVEQAISDLPRLEAGGGEEPMPYASDPLSDFQRLMRNGNGSVYDHVARALAPMQLARLQAIKPGQRMKDLPAHLQAKKGYGGAYSRLEWDKPALTITTWVFHPGSGRFGHPVDDRTITMREAARLQSFDDDFRFTGSYNSKSRQIGNAVPPLLAQRLAEVLRLQLDAGAHG